MILALIISVFLKRTYPKGFCKFSEIVFASKATMRLGLISLVLYLDIVVLSRPLRSSIERTLERRSSRMMIDWRFFNGIFDIYKLIK